MKSIHIHHILFLCLTFLFILACSFTATPEPPGVGEKAEQGYVASNPVINALKVYHEATGAYPESLTDLVPTYISSIPTEVNDIPIQYERSGESYTLSFGYTGPGMNYCKYSPEQGWHCSGAY